MRLATIRTGRGTRAVRIDGVHALETGHPDVGALLTEQDWRQAAAGAQGPAHDTGTLDYAPVVPRPGKIFCVGVNFAAHIREMGRRGWPRPQAAPLPSARAGAHHYDHRPGGVPEHLPGGEVNPPPTVGWWQAGERFFATALGQLTGDDFDEPSLLPGWPRRTVVAHVARNADALVNLLTWARTGWRHPCTRRRKRATRASAKRPRCPART
jgi:hypothetical protein